MAYVDELNEDGRPFVDAVDFPELSKCLLIQAFDGRPLRVVKNTHDPLGMQPYAVLIASDVKEHFCILVLSAEEISQLESDFTEFERKVAKPILNNLDGMDYPERWERYIKAAKRISELLVDAA